MMANVKRARAPSRTYNVYVVIDEATWNDGMSLTDVTGTPTQVTTNLNGYIWPTSVWPTAVPGKYDIVVDVDGSKTYTAGDILDDNDILVTQAFSSSQNTRWEQFWAWQCASQH